MRPAGWGAAGDVVGGQLLAGGGDRPAVAERVAQDAVALAPEHFLDRDLDLCAGVDGPLGDDVGVLDLQVQQDRTAADGRWRQRVERGGLLAEQQPGGADGQLDEQDSAVGQAVAQQLGGAERGAVERDRAVGVADEQVGGEAGEAREGHGGSLVGSRPAFMAAAARRWCRAASAWAAWRPWGVSR
jgi:hypothetical protein